MSLRTTNFFSSSLDVDALTVSFSRISFSSTESYKALEAFSKGQNIDSHIHWLDHANFSKLPIGDIQANILLLLCRYSRYQRVEDISLLFKLLPYYIADLSIDNDKLTASIISQELKSFIDSADRQLLFDLDLRVAQFLRGNSFCNHSKNTELQYLAKLIQKLQLKYQTTIQDEFISSLAAWSSVVSPDPAHYAAVIRRVLEITCSNSKQAEKAPILAYFSYLQRLNISSSYADHFFKELYVWQIEKVTAGKDISNYAGFLESTLLNKEKCCYSTFTIEHKLANVWLLILAFEQTKDPRYLPVLELALPYVARYVNSLVPMPTASQITDGAAAIPELNSSAFAKFLLDSNIHFTLDGAAQALALHTQNDETAVDETKAAVQLFSNMISQRHATCALLECYAQKAPDDVTMTLQILHALSSDPKSTTLLEWIETLAVDATTDCFVGLVNAPEFSDSMRESIMFHLLRDTAPKSSLALALRLLPSIKSDQIPTLLLRVDQSECIDLFAREVAHVSDELVNQFHKALQPRPKFLGKLEKTLRNDPVHPGIDFLISYINSKYASVNERIQIIKVFRHVKAPSHYLPLALRVTLKNDATTINEIVDELIERSNKDPDSATIVTFLRDINSGKVDWSIRDRICRYLLEKNSPASLLLLARMSVDLPLSALWTLIKRIDGLKPKNDLEQQCRRSALQSLLTARWYPDNNYRHSPEQREITLNQLLEAKEAGKTFRYPSFWYQNRNIILCTPNDSYASRIPETIRYLMRKCGLKGKKIEVRAAEHIQELLLLQQEARKQGRAKMVPPYKGFLKYFTRKAEMQRRAEAANRAQTAEAILEVCAEREEIERPMSPGPDSQD